MKDHDYLKGDGSQQFGLDWGDQLLVMGLLSLYPSSNLLHIAADSLSTLETVTCCCSPLNPNPKTLDFRPTHRLLSSSFLWLIYVESYKVIPKRNYYGAYG